MSSLFYMLIMIVFPKHCFVNEYDGTFLVNFAINHWNIFLTCFLKLSCELVTEKSCIGEFLFHCAAFGNCQEIWPQIILLISNKNALHLNQCIKGHFPSNKMSNIFEVHF